MSLPGGWVLSIPVINKNHLLLICPIIAGRYCSNISSRYFLQAIKKSAHLAVDRNYRQSHIPVTQQAQHKLPFNANLP
jgi:hypothetical protein